MATDEVLAPDLSFRVRRGSGSLASRQWNPLPHWFTRDAGRAASRRFFVSLGGQRLSARGRWTLGVSGSREIVRGPSVTQGSDWDSARGGYELSGSLGQP